MINKFVRNKLDDEALKGMSSEISITKDDTNDFKKVVVKKPWGYEYLIFQSNNSAIWILYIKPKHQTSMQSIQLYLS